MRKSLLFAATAALIFGGGCGRGKENAEEKKTKKQVPVLVNVQTLTVSDFEHFGTYYGKIEPMNEAVLIAYAGGRVSYLGVQEGQWVKKGKSLAKIDAEKARVLYETALLGEKVAKDAWERQKKHQEEGNVSQVSVDEFHLRYLSAWQQRIDAAKMRDGALCIAPFSGRVVRRMIETYDEVAPGSPTFVLAQMGKMKVTVSLPESDIISVENGNKAIMSVSGYPQRVWEGTVKSIARMANPATKKFEVEIIVENEDGALVSGVTGKTQLLIQTYSDNIVVPTISLLSEGEESYVMVVQNASAVKTKVQTGPSNEDQTVILSGLTPGEQLIVSGQSLVANGTPVTIATGE